MELARSAQQEADSFEKDIKDAKRDASEAKTLLAEVRQLAADAEGRAANAERKVADRHITPAQKSRLVAELRKWTDIELPIVVVNGDGEANAFADELLKALAVIPTWSLELSEERTNSGMSGLFVRIDKEATDRERAFADDLVNALHTAAMQAGGPTLPPFRGTITGGGRSLLSGKFWPQSPMYDPTIRSRKHNVGIEVGVKP
jgi:hypothetical protein